MMNGLFGPEAPDWRQALPQMGLQQQPQVQQPKIPTSGGMFGRRRGIDIGQLGAMILAANGNQLGTFALQQRSQQQQAQDEMKQRQLQREQDLADRWNMWERQQRFQQANPDPYRFRNNSGDVVEIRGGEQRVLYDDPNPRVQWQRVTDPDTGAISIIPVGLHGGGADAGLTDEEMDELERGGQGSQAPGPFSGMERTTTGAIERATVSSESNGRRFDRTGGLTRGPVTRNGEQAMGEFQVMPSTARDPGFGIRPWNGRDPDDLARVGREYLRVMRRRYNNDLSKMWAAYNWGPGNVDAAIRQHGRNWQNAAPPETRDYIRSNFQQIRRGP